MVGCTFDHRIADAYSANMFLVAWARMAADHDSRLPPPPTFRRSLLNPRRPGAVDPSLDDMYMPVTALPPPAAAKPKENQDHLISRIYYVEAHQLQHLQSLASSSGGQKRTKLESFSAFLWKLVATGAGAVPVEYHDDPTTKPSPLGQLRCKMGIVVDGRTRLSDEDPHQHQSHDHDQAKAKLMGSYFGNVLSIPFGSDAVEDLIQHPLDWVASQVHDFIRGAVTKEHFLGLIDWVEAHRPVPGLAKIYGSGSQDGPAFVVSSGQRFPVSEIDFGWGRPFFGSYHFPWGGDAGYVMPMPTPATPATANGDWVVYMHLSRAQLELVDKVAAHVFRPLTFDYLDNIHSLPLSSHN